MYMFVCMIYIYIYTCRYMIINKFLALLVVSIRWPRLQAMVRQTLSLSPGQVPDDDVMGLWNALDPGNSGELPLQAFGRFMRLGEHVHDRERAERLEALEAERSVAFEATRRERKALREACDRERASSAEEARARGALLYRQRRDASRCMAEAEAARKAGRLAERRAVRLRLAELRERVSVPVAPRLPHTAR